MENNDESVRGKTLTRNHMILAISIGLVIACANLYITGSLSGLKSIAKPEGGFEHIDPLGELFEKSSPHKRLLKGKKKQVKKGAKVSGKTPVAPPPTNGTRFLQDENENEKENGKLSQEDIELLEGFNPCFRVDVGRGDDLEIRKMCRDYELLPHIIPDCSEQTDIVPKIIHSVNKDGSVEFHQKSTYASNPDYTRNHHSDETAFRYISEKCGEEAANAYSCIVPPAFRADLFRFCALYAEGGVYLDNDIFPLKPLEEIYSSCSIATMGHDQPQKGVPKKQMKILAGTPGAPIFKCAMDHILNIVRFQIIPENVFDISGPGVLQKCYEENSENVAVNYHDTRNAMWPWTGMRSGNKILAIEVPIQLKHFIGGDPEDYYELFLQQKIYKPECLKVENE